jgi:polyhydroxybutyrate depolymerase
MIMLPLTNQARPFPKQTIALGILLITLACARAKTPSPVTLPSLPIGETTRTLTHDGLERSYVLYVPASVNESQPIPLIFILHGGTGNAKSAIRMSEFNPIADQNGFIVVYPNGTNRLGNDKFLTWNGGTCCGYAQENNIDDVGFMRAIVVDLQALTNIDAKRLYVTGMSNGGVLSHRLGCEASDIFAAIAPAAGTLNFAPCQPTHSISILEFHGTDDRHIPYNGGTGPDSLVDVDFASVPDSVGFWVSFNGCNTQPLTNTSDDIQHDVWTGCRGSTAVELYTIIDGGHVWPQSVPSLSETETKTASQLIWDFFAAHPKP